MDMSQALVRADIAAASSGGYRLLVRATGLEGLIKQKVGAKAADRIAKGVAQGS